MEVVIILSHLMSKEGILSYESIKRAEKAAKICIDRNCSFLLTSGWAYRRDNSLAIGKVVAKYIKKHFQLGNCKVIFDINSRDTVGDAYFLRKKLSNIKYSKLIVVTSDYHMNRASKIFKNFFSSCHLETVGIKTNLFKDKDVTKKEKDSLVIFGKTFKNINFESNTDIYRVLRESHPYYNGEIYSKI